MLLSHFFSNQVLHLHGRGSQITLQICYICNLFIIDIYIEGYNKQVNTTNKKKKNTKKKIKIIILRERETSLTRIVQKLASFRCPFLIMSCLDPLAGYCNGWLRWVSNANTCQKGETGHRNLDSKFRSHV